MASYRSNVVVRRMAAVGLAAMAALAGCRDKQAAAPTSSPPTMPVATGIPSPTSPPRTLPPDAPPAIDDGAGVRGTMPKSIDSCPGNPPFRFGYLPAGFRGELRPYDERPGPRAPDDVREPYDPLFHLAGPAGSQLVLHHGNSWRLIPTPQQEITVLGRPAAVSRFADGRTIVEFRVAATGSHCDWWAVSGGVAADEVVAVARGLRLS